MNQTELTWTELKTRQEMRWTKLFSWIESLPVARPPWSDVTLSHWCYSASRPSGMWLYWFWKKKNSSNLSFFLIWLFLAMASHGGLHWYIFWQWSFEEDWGSGDTEALACVCVLIKAVWPQNALSMFVCVHVLIRAVCSQCALVFSVLWLNNRSDVFQEQMRGGKNRVSWMRGEKNR